MLNLESDIKYIKGVGEKRAELFNKLGIFCVEDLIEYFPRGYQDWSVKKTVEDCESGETACLQATMITTVKESLIRKGLTLYKCNFTDGKTVIRVTIFNNKYLANSLKIYEHYTLYGKIEKKLTYAEMSSPKIELAGVTPPIMPIYPATERLNSKAIAKTIRTALYQIEKIPEILPEKIRIKYNKMRYMF